MITTDNLRELLLSLEFVKDTTNLNDVMTRRFSENDTQISVDFSTSQITILRLFFNGSEEPSV